MKKKNSVLRKVLAVALSAVTLLGIGFTTVGQFVGTSVSVSATDTLIYGDFQYEVNDDNTITITGYTGNNSAVDIPYKINGKTITKIGDYAFKERTSINVITISDSVTAIGQGAFYKCTNLESVKLSNNLKTFENYLFLGCENLSNIVIPDSIVRIGWGVFSNCISLDNVVIPNGVKKIGGCAFRECTNLKNISIGNGVTAIDGGAFQLCSSLNSIFVPASVEFIDGNIFYKCDNLSNIQIDNNNSFYKSHDGVMYDKSMSKLMSFPPNKEGNYVIPDTVTEISASSCAYCTKLKSITISKKITYIQDSAFVGCCELSEVIISETNNYAIIYPFAFYDCPKLKIVYIPESVWQINYNSFGYFMGKYGNMKVDGFTIKGNKDSVAEEYANKNDIDFVLAKEKLENESEISSKMITLGSTVTINAKADGGKGGYNYAVLYKKNADTTWTVRQNYNTNDIIIVKPTKATDYDICVKVKDNVTGNIVKKFFTVKVVNNPIENTSKISAGTIQAGDTVTINCSAKGGNGNYKYSVQYKKQSEQNWISTMGFATVTTMPLKFSQVGKYDISVKVKDDIGNIKEKIFTVNVIDKLENNSKISATTINIGKTITATGSATGGIGEYQYQILYKQTAQSSWTKAQDFNTNSVVTFKPAKATTYDVCVKVKDSNGTIVKKFFTVQVNAKLTNTSAVSETTIKKGDTVAVNGSATGGAGDYTYAVYYKQKAQTKWTVKQDFNENSDVSVKPAQATDYDICVKVKDKDGTIAKQYFTVTVTK